MPKLPAAVRALIAKMRTDPIFGEEIARAAREHGVVQGHLGMPEGGAAKKVILQTDLLNRIPQSAHVIGSDPRKAWAQFNYPGSPSLESDKLLEARLFKNFIPNTHGMADVVESMGIPSDAVDTPELHARILAKVKELVGKNFIFKDRYGFGSHGGMVTETDKRLPVGLAELKNYIVQSRAPLARTSTAELFADQLYNVHLQHPNMSWIDKIKNAWKTRESVGRVQGATSTTGKGNVEYRVHAVGGKVIPYNAINRGSLLGIHNPIHTPEMRRAELLAQRAVDALPPEVRNNTFGFDIARRGDNGKLMIIESNPSLPGSTSGYLDMPQVEDAMQAAVMGKLPSRIKALRAAAALGVGAPVAAMAVPDDETPFITAVKQRATQAFG